MNKTGCLFVVILSSLLAVAIYYWLLTEAKLPSTKEMRDQVFLIAMVFGAPLGWYLGRHVIGPWMSRTPGRRLFSLVSTILFVLGSWAIFPKDPIVKWGSIVISIYGIVLIFFKTYQDNDSTDAYYEDHV
jgi:hypothetical protein